MLKEILLIEDSSADAKLISIAIQNTIPNAIVRVANDGESGLNEISLRKPYLILLDLNLPKKSGIEILNEIHSDPSLHSIPVIVLTNSTSPRDIEAAYSACANAYIRKPVGFEYILDAMSVIKKFWFDLAVVS